MLCSYPHVSAMSLGNSGSLQLVFGTQTGTSSWVPFRMNVPLSKQINRGLTPVWGIIVLKSCSRIKIRPENEFLYISSES